MKKYLFLIIILLAFALPAQGAQGQESSVVLTWSADSYVPVGYLSKALPSSGSRIELAAAVFHNEPEKLSYTWSLSRNYYLQRRVTEKGMQTFDFVIDNKIHTIEIIVRDDQNAIVGRSSVTIKPVEPEVVLLANRAADDASNSQMKKYQLASNQSLKFTAQPYFFNISSLNELDYGWKFDNQTAEEDLENPNVFNLKIGEVADVLVKDIQLTMDNFSASAQIVLVP